LTNQQPDRESFLAPFRVEQTLQLAVLKHIAMSTHSGRDCYSKADTGRHLVQEAVSPSGACSAD
jgi:hypothetical protein